ncbi:DUF190 domain-containing protein [Spirosoma pollinicola]|uniref:Uncharacterized protein n=1 Tax=Spirosoma pollinicola TaxID=2057025 RepID=A0A2K8Z659_9BACT|nr:DUF190 domain-containing protein [Spirosoma pollinicola]AUD05376.1 hypothetical protein CWM47_28095 [Spirosoma pollinicola]
MRTSDFTLLNLSTVRIYLHHGQRVPTDSMWEKLLGKNLAHAILKEAKLAGLKQAILYPIRAGFLRDAELVFTHAEATPRQMPVCIELVDEPQTLKDFIQQHQRLLTNTHVILENPQTYQLIQRA